MKKIKFGNFIKNILAVLLIVLIFSGQTVAFARAGGGSSGSSHGGTSHSSSPSHSSSSSTRSSKRYGFIDFIIAIGTLIFVSILVSIIVRKVRLTKNKYKSISVIQNLSKYDGNWDYDSLMKDIKDAFYMVQIAWRERNQDLAKECMSEYLYGKHKFQTEEMKLLKEKNILENTVLLDAIPIGLQDLGGIDKDYVWVHIKAKCRDFTINEETNEIINKKSSKDEYFEEYWKFIRNEKRWVLDDIRQIDQITDLDFFRIDAPNRYY
jgi:predicted lipid-binding transport protein (Tim44 family)